MTLTEMIIGFVVFMVALLINFRLIYIRGYKSGAAAVVKQWKQTMEEETD